MRQDTQSIFRAQVVDRQRATALGEILLSQGASTKILTMLFASIAMAIIAFMMLASITRKAVVAGVLTPSAGLIRVFPSQSGVVVRQRVKEGQLVSAGEEIALLSSDRGSADASETRKAVSALIEARRKSLLVDQMHQQRQNEERLRAARRKASDLQVELTRIDQQMSVQGQRIEMANEALARFQNLQSSNFVSSAQVDTYRAGVLDQRQRLGDLARVRAGIERDISAATSASREIELQIVRDEESGKRAESSAAQDLTENEAKRESGIRAPADGVVASLNVVLGQAVQENQPIASLVPTDSPLEAELYVPSRSIGFLKPGMKVMMRYEAFPYQKFGQFEGTVRDISIASLRPEELVAGLRPVKDTEPVYRVRVFLNEQVMRAYGVLQPLRAGMLLEASVLIEKRRLYQWVLDPLSSLMERV